MLCKNISVGIKIQKYLKNLNCVNKICNSMNDSGDSIISEYLTKLITPKYSCWSILKGFLNNQKTPIIPPLFSENRFVIDFTKKAKLFNTLVNGQPKEFSKTFYKKVFA